MLANTTAARSAWSILCAVALLAAIPACGGSATSPAPTPPTLTPTVAVTPSPTSTPSPTPDPLGPPPATAADAVRQLGPVLADQPRGTCYAPLLANWGAVCKTGDIDADGIPDEAYLVPLLGGEGASRAPAVVVVRASGLAALVRFPPGEDADNSPLGEGIFSVGDRTGSGGAEITLLVTRCGASNCISSIEMPSWDGTSWRNAGPANVTFDNPDLIAVEGSGADSTITVHAGAQGSVGAGPSRASTSVFELLEGVYQRVSYTPDAATYLFHAVLDADALFDLGKFSDAAGAYAALVGDATLTDWREEATGRPGRPTLESYALFRIAVATAARGDDPTEAIDAVITNAQDALFVEGIQAFRRGFQAGGSVTQACIEATRYFSTPTASRLIDERFDYGYGNPRKKPTDLCPL